MKAYVPPLVLLCLLHSAASFAQTTQTSWLFDTDGNSEGWTAANIQAQIVSGGSWVINPNPSDPQMISPLLSRSPSSVNYMKIGISNTGPNTSGRVYFSGPGLGYSESRSRGFTDPSNGRYNWIIIRLDDISSWGSASNIDHVRIDPVASGSSSGGSDDVATDFIFLRYDGTNPDRPTITSVSPSSWTNGSITVCFESNDPPDMNPVGPDVYGSGINEFVYRVDPHADQSKVPDSFNDRTGLATACVAYAPGSLANGANQFHVYCWDKTGHVGQDRQATLYYDGVNPSAPSSISSSSHTCSVWSADNTIAASWSGASDAHSGIDGYSWRWSQSASTVPNASKDGSGTSTTSQALASGTWYLHVRTLDKAGNISGTRHSCAFRVDTVAPSNPSSLTPTSHTCNTWSTDSTIDICWSGAADAHSGVAGYSWAWSNSTTTIPGATIDGTGTCTTSPDLADGTWYFHLRTSDNAGNSASSTLHSCAFWIDTVAPSNPATITLSHTPSVPSCDNTIDVTWSGALDATSGIAGYSWLWDTSPATIPDQTIDGTSGSTTSPVLADGNSHYFHLRTADNAGNWAPTAEHRGPFVIGATGPGPVANLVSTTHTPSAWSNVNSIDLSWEAPAEVCGGIAGYSYEWSTAPDTEPDETVETTSTGVTLPGLADGCGYFHVRAIDVASMGSPPVHLGPFCIDTAAPINPSMFASSSHTPSQWSMDNTVDVYWSGASDGLSGVGGYSFLWDTSPGTLPDTIEEGPDTLTTSPSLAEGTDHYVHLRTRDMAGNWSGEAIHLGPFWIDTSGPAEVTGLQSPSHVLGTWSNDNTIDVLWTPPGGGGSGIAGYSFVWDNAATTDPDATVETGNLATTSPSQPDGQRYFHIRAVDGANNPGPTSHLGPFPIDATPPAALVTRPNGGETWYAGDVEAIEFGYFDGNSGVLTLELRYSTDDGATYPNLISQPSLGVSVYDWTVPHDPSATARVELIVTDRAGNVHEDQSNNVFNLSEQPTAASPPGITQFALYQNVPNPFNPITEIRYNVPPGGGHVVLRIYDVGGKLVRTLADGSESDGRKTVTWDGRDERGESVPSGLYFYRLTSKTFSETRKMMLLK